MADVRAKKQLGQHFLTDELIAKRIVDALQTETKHVLEVGPGMGVLTKYLFANDQFKTTALDIDEESIAYLKTKYPEHADQVVYGDFLNGNILDFSEGEELAVIGNFPYNISSQIFFKVLDFKDQVPQVVGMLQKEVAERLASPPGSKAYGILSVLLQAWYDVEYLFTVHEDVFNPPPKVKSGVIRCTRNNVQELGCNEKLFKTVIKTSFGQRRKMLSNSLKGMMNGNKTEDALFNRRPEQLSVEEFITLTNIIENFKK